VAHLDDRMTSTLRKILRLSAAAALLLVSFVNLSRYKDGLFYLQSREDDPVSTWESRILPVRYALIRAGYTRGDIGYISPSFFAGKPKRSLDEEIRWCIVRYGMIPWNLLDDPRPARYVIMDYVGISPVPPVPAGFKNLYESRDGLFLLYREGQ
jgi:hypothetical protein